MVNMMTYFLGTGIIG